MNLIHNLVERIEACYVTNKKPCKTFANEKTANDKASFYAQKIADYFGADASKVEYVVFFVPKMGRWTAAYNLKPLLRIYGGYIGIASEYGFFSY